MSGRDGEGVGGLFLPVQLIQNFKHFADDVFGWNADNFRIPMNCGDFGFSACRFDLINLAVFAP